MMDLQAIEDAVARVDFYVPFYLSADGQVTERLDLDGPQVYHDPTNDIEVDGSEHWRALTGYTGQYGYRGAVMHASEYVGGGLLRDMLDDPGVYVLTVVEVLPEDDEDGDEFPEPAGWAILKWTDES